MGKIGDTAGESSRIRTGVTRREWFKTAAGGCAGLALGGLVDVAAVQAPSANFACPSVQRVA
jgi:hypothetical protein